jgi:hypothetical protein
MANWMTNEPFNYQAILFNDDRMNVNILHTNDLLKLASVAEQIKVSLLGFYFLENQI